MGLNPTLNVMAGKIGSELPGISSGKIIVIGACVCGERHAKEGKPCQDTFSWSHIPENGVVVALADGLSSKPCAETGARIGVEAVCEAVVSAYRENNPIDQKVLIREAFRIAHQKVMNEAERTGINSSSYGTTLIGAIFFNRRITVGHIGDGIVAGIQEGKTLIISEPGQSEYANETASLVQPDWETHLRVTEAPDIDAGILTTDGCQGAVATRQSGNLHPYDPFLLPLISFIRKKTDNGEDSSSDITSLLTSSRMLELSGDDKTLVILLGPPLVP